jgi:hypothetical protein
MYSLHGLLALIRPLAGAGVPRVDRRVVLHTRVGAPPRGVRDVVPQLAGVERSRPRRRAERRLPLDPRPDASKNASGMRTELLEFWPLTVWYDSPLKS